MSITTRAGRALPLSVVLRWSALVGDDLHMATELFQQSEAHNSQLCNIQY